MLSTPSSLRGPSVCPRTALRPTLAPSTRDAPRHFQAVGTEGIQGQTGLAGRPGGATAPEGRQKPFQEGGNPRALGGQQGWGSWPGSREDALRCQCRRWWEQEPKGLKKKKGLESRTGNSGPPCSVSQPDPSARPLGSHPATPHLPQHSVHLSSIVTSLFFLTE